MSTESMHIAISGTGIAGPALAWWLMRAGHRPTLIERAPQLRTRGFVIDLSGPGLAIAKRMGLLPEIEAASYRAEEVCLVDEAGSTIGRIDTALLELDRTTHRMSLPRSDLAVTLYQALGTEIEALFGTTILSLEEHDQGVRAVLSNGEERDFDLVVGADGINSTVRGLAFGDDVPGGDRSCHYVAAFDAPGDAGTGPCRVVYTEPGRQISRFIDPNGHASFQFLFANRWMIGSPPESAADRKRALMLACSGMGWEWPRIAERLAPTDDIYLDRVREVCLPSWSKGRIALIGDAAAAVSTMAGEGASLAMLEAYVLAGEIAASAGNYRGAFRAYEQRLRGYLVQRQRRARTIARACLPRTELGILLRSLAAGLARKPRIARFLAGHKAEAFELPRYAFGKG